MKKIFTIVLLFSVLSSVGQNVKETKTSIRTINEICTAYKHSCENVESQKNQDAFKKAINSLNIISNEKDFQILIEAWMYYDPTDFPTRSLIEPVLIKNKKLALKAVNKRLANKTEWEYEYTAPYSDLSSLKSKLIR